MRFLRTTLLLLAVAAVFYTLRAASAAPEVNAGDIFKQKCAMCHGPDGKGIKMINTPDFTSAKWQASVTDSTIVDTIKNGKKGTAMPPWGDKLKPEEVTALLHYIRSLKK